MTIVKCFRYSIPYFYTNMGQLLGTAATRHLNLNMNDKPTFPIDKGFSFKRQIRTTAATPEQLSSAKIPLQYRDYCADQLLKYQVCRYKHMPFVVKCHCEKHAYLVCEKEDYIIRMKEFERERRLRERELRINPPPPPPPPPPPKPKKKHGWH